MIFQQFWSKAPVKTPVKTVRFAKSLEGLQIVRDFVRTSLFIKSYPNSGFGGSRCRKLCTVGDLDAEVQIFVEFWRVQVPKVLYCWRLGWKSSNIPLVLEGPGAESAILWATWKQKYQYSLGFERFQGKHYIPSVLECLGRLGKNNNILLIFNDSADRIGENLWFRRHSGGCLGHLNHSALGRIEFRFG